MNKLFLVDGMSLVFRAYHAMSKSNLKSPSGEPTGAIFGFVNLITSLLEKENPQNLIIVFDRKEPTFRHEIYEDYKANREEFPEDLIPQMIRIKEFLDYAKIPRMELATYEADDIIGTVANKASQNGMQVVCITSDKDFYQLVDDKIKIYKPSRDKNQDFDIVSFEEVKQKFGVTPDKVIDVLAILGDAIDNVPGVKGIGEKTAIPLIQKYGSLENLYENLNEIENKSVKSKLESNKENAFLSKKLVTIDKNVPIDINFNEFKLKKPDYSNIDKLFETLGFNTIRKKWLQRASLDLGETIEIKTETDTIENIKKNYTLINEITQLKQLISELQTYKTLSVDLETSSLNRQTCEIVGIALCGQETKAFYIAVSNKTKKNFNSDNVQVDLFSSIKNDNISSTYKTIPISDAINLLKSILENPNIEKCGQNIKFDAYILKRYGIELAPITFDTMIASYILNPDEQHNLDAISKKWLNYTPIPISSLIGEKKSKQISMKDLNPEDISDYACEDADLALKLKNILEKELIKEKLIDLAQKIEFPLIKVLTEMEFNGIAINKDFLNNYSLELKNEAINLTKKIYKEAGTEFNIDSPLQLQHILFEKMMLNPIKKTKTGYSTDVQVLTELAQTEPIAQMILEYRQIMKLNSTYVEALPKLIDSKTGRIHTTYNQTIATTGRLSSTDPNLQNIPIRTDMGSKVREAFIPGHPDNFILSADYSQIELRIMAYYSKDDHLIKAFQDGLDIHSATASNLFDKQIIDIDSNMRRIAKTVNFGIMYGLGSYGLAQRLGISRNQAKEIIDNYFKKYPGIKKYMDDTIHSTQQKGYAETMFGRRRFLPDINSNNQNLRSAAERAAINMPIQGSASDMIKLAMINVFNSMKNKNLKSMMMLQVHDELVFEVFPDELDIMKNLIKTQMENAVSLGNVPLLVDIGIGKNWFQAH